MYSILKDVKNHIQSRNCFIDNAVFQLHYRWTFALLVASSILAITNQYVNNIDCMVEGETAGKIINSYCWILGTFTIPSQLIGSETVIYPGVASPTASNTGNGNTGSNDAEDETYHAWYQWVSLILMLQALMCYFPHYLWKTLEGGKLAMIMKGIDGLQMKETEDLKTKRDDIVQYLKKMTGRHGWYAAKFVICEFLNLVSIGLQWYFMELFFGYQFSKYGIEVLWQKSLPIDPMAKVFPKMTKCTFKHFGMSGSVENKDAECILPLNIFNEKIYALIWFWSIILSAITFLHLTARVSQIVQSIFHNNTSQSGISYFGDRFILMQMRKFIDPVLYEQIVSDYEGSKRNGRTPLLNRNESTQSIRTSPV